MVLLTGREAIAQARWCGVHLWTLSGAFHELILRDDGYVAVATWSE